MRRPEPYETTYRHDKRKHRHRCRCCQRILEAGQNVLMWRIKHNKTFAIHTDCASLKAVPDSPTTWRDLAQMQSDEYARRLGHRI